MVNPGLEVKKSFYHKMPSTQLLIDPFLGSADANHAAEQKISYNLGLMLIKNL